MVYKQELAETLPFSKEKNSNKFQLNTLQLDAYEEVRPGWNDIRIGWCRDLINMSISDNLTETKKIYAINMSIRDSEDRELFYKPLQLRV